MQYLCQLSTVGFSSEGSTNWTPSETDKLLNGWEKNIKEVNQSQNEEVMAELAELVGNGKTGQQVRAKVCVCWRVSYPTPSTETVSART